MKVEYREAFTEVAEIIKLMPEELINKIPKKFLELINEEKDKEYIVNIKEPLEELKLKNETVIILGLIYRDFLTDDVERKRLQEKDEMELHIMQKEIEAELREKYNPDNLFKKKNIENNIANDITTTTANNNILPVVVQKEGFFSKIVNFLKRVFHKSR